MQSAHSISNTTGPGEFGIHQQTSGQLVHDMTRHSLALHCFCGNETNTFVGIQHGKELNLFSPFWEQVLKLLTV